MFRSKSSFSWRGIRKAVGGSETNFSNFLRLEIGFTKIELWKFKILWWDNDRWSDSNQTSVASYGNWFGLQLSDNRDGLGFREHGSSRLIVGSTVNMLVKMSTLGIESTIWESSILGVVELIACSSPCDLSSSELVGALWFSRPVGIEYNQTTLVLMFINKPFFDVKIHAFAFVKYVYL